ncbi:MAG: hypothetical protein HC896_04485 [Bacteroidales bacterium]|nr:hypothetical protein [Bacteroidales bacterium]
MAFRSGTWSKIALNSSIESKVTAFEQTFQLNKGETGTALSRLAPMGKVAFNNQVYEGKSMSGFIDEGSTVVFVKTEGNTILVKKS